MATQVECSEVSIVIKQTLATFRRDLPELLQEHFGEWVAYHLDRRVGFGQSKTSLYRQCLAEGIARGQFIERRVVPEVARVVEDRPV